MDRVVRFSPDERSGLFTQTAANMGITPALVEKDFWVSWVRYWLGSKLITGPCRT